MYTSGTNGGVLGACLVRVTSHYLSSCRAAVPRCVCVCVCVCV